MRDGAIDPVMRGLDPRIQAAAPLGKGHNSCIRGRSGQPDARELVAGSTMPVVLFCAARSWLCKTGAPVAKVIPTNLGETREVSAGAAFVGLLLDSAAIFLNVFSWIFVLVAVIFPFYAAFTQNKPLPELTIFIVASAVASLLLAGITWLLSRGIARHGRIALVFAGLCCLGSVALQIHGLGHDVKPPLIATVTQSALLLFYGLVFFWAAWKRKALDG
jgi:hypothetical protein